MRKWKDGTYMEMMREKMPFINTEIVKLPQPIVLYSAILHTSMRFIRVSTKSMKQAKYFFIFVTISFHTIEPIYTTEIFLQRNNLHLCKKISY